MHDLNAMHLPIWTCNITVRTIYDKKIAKAQPPFSSVQAQCARCMCAVACLDGHSKLAVFLHVYLT